MHINISMYISCLIDNFKPIQVHVIHVTLTINKNTCYNNNNNRFGVKKKNPEYNSMACDITFEHDKDFTYF